MSQMEFDCTFSVIFYNLMITVEDRTVKVVLKETDYTDVKNIVIL